MKTREALVYAPATTKTDPSPVVFAFHGHGGTMKFAATKFAYHKHWPEAIAVYMQGLKTPGTLRFECSGYRQNPATGQLQEPQCPLPVKQEVLVHYEEAFGMQARFQAHMISKISTPVL